MNRLNSKLLLLIGTTIATGSTLLLLWLLPISGQVIVTSGDTASVQGWPRFTINPAVPQGGEVVTITATDLQPWVHIRLMINGRTMTLLDSRTAMGFSGTTWRWTTQLPEETPPHLTVELYSDCHSGCQLRGQTSFPTGVPSPPEEVTIPMPSHATKLCAIFPNPTREWYGRSAWVVDMTYVRWADQTEDRYWSVDALAERVHDAAEKGLHVLVRVDFDKGQTLPPTGDLLALEAYLAYMQRLARDQRLQDVYGYIIGSGYNALDSSSLAPDAPITPAWYARLLNGYGEPIDRQDNVMQRVRAENPQARLLVGPIRPWIHDQSGSIAYAIDVPWLSYMNTVVALLAESAVAKAAAGDTRALPDGFALNIPGRVDAPELAGVNAAQEPQLDLPRAEWAGAQAGFRVYQDFLNVINHSPIMQGLPVYISTTNTYTPDQGIPPAQNYPRGWLTNALAEVDTQPQIRTLCWFLDLIPGDPQWDAFSLTRPLGRMQDASDEFDELLQHTAIEE